MLGIAIEMNPGLACWLDALTGAHCIPLFEILTFSVDRECQNFEKKEYSAPVYWVQGQLSWGESNVQQSDDSGCDVAKICNLVQAFSWSATEECAFVAYIIRYVIALICFSILLSLTYQY